jgi:hypothetical protein
MDGLYWLADSGNVPSPLSKFLPQALLQTYDWSQGKGPRLFHGYVFRILTRQGPATPGGKMNYVKDGRMSEGFALVAYPVRFGESGIMTFIVNQDGIVYQRCLGEKTAELASHMKEYNPATGWAAVTEQGITDLMADSKQEPAH